MVLSLLFMWMSKDMQVPHGISQIEPETEEDKKIHELAQNLR